MAKSNATSVTNSRFPTEGTSVASSVSALPVVKGKSIKKTAEAKGGMLAAATAAHRPNIQENMGSSLHPQPAILQPNSPEAEQTQRNTVLVPSAIGNRDFWAKRQYGQADPNASSMSGGSWFNPSSGKTS